jgi:phage head maturation protease
MHVSHGSVGILEADARRIAMVFAGRICWGGYGAGRVEEIDLEAGDLSMLNSGAPLLLDHGHTIDALVGIIEAAWIEGDQAMAVARVTAANARGREVWAMLQDGIIRSCSMGFIYQAAKAVEDEPLDRAPKIEKWRPHEISLVPLPSNWNATLQRGIAPAEVDAIAAAALQVRQAALLKKIREGQRDQWRDLARGIAPAVAGQLGTDEGKTLAALLDALQ